MNFENLIDRYSVDFEIIAKSGGEYIAGEYVEKRSDPLPSRGAIVSIPRRKIYQSGGYLTAKDLRLFVYDPLQGEDLKIKYKGSLYSVEDDTDYSEFAGVTAYILKWVSSFDKDQSNDS